MEGGKKIGEIFFFSSHSFYMVYGFVMIYLRDRLLGAFSRKWKSMLPPIASGRYEHEARLSRDW